MLNRKEYNDAFKTNLTEEQFNEINANPITDISRLTEIALANKNGNVWYFLPKEKAILIEQLLRILPKHEDYIHTKTYPYNETMEDIYYKGHKEGWNACLKAIKEELDDWRKENEIDGC